MTTRTDDDQTIDLLARSLSADSIRATTEAGSGHPTSSMSASHIVAALLTKHFRFNPERPDDLANDRLVLSKGHASPLLYAALAAAGVVDRDRLTSLRQLGSPLEGHPVPGLPMIDVATGSLGQGLANGLGMAMGLRRLGSPARVFVILGDSEMTEGSVWEAMALASHMGLSNLVAILDMNRLGQRGPTMYGWDSDVYEQRAQAFGWRTDTVAGHEPSDLEAAFAAASEATTPTLLVARTVKGKGVSFLENAEGRHGKALDDEETVAALEELDVDESPSLALLPPPEFGAPVMTKAEPDLPEYDEPAATRDAFGAALAAHASADPRIAVLDGEVANSTRTKEVAATTPDQFHEMYIAEQAMIGAAVGLDAVGFRPVAATFAAFMTRAHDFLRMARISRSTMLVSGSHAGVSIGEDGPSQMGLDDLAMMRAIPESTVLYPADANSTVALVSEALRRTGITYIRTTRGETPSLYPARTSFPIGGSKILRSTPGDIATIVAAGVTVFEALDAADELLAEGLAVRVIDAYSVAPLDEATLLRAADETGRFIVVEDHSTAGGIGDAVSEVVAPSGSMVHRLGVRTVPGSATPQEQRRLAGIDAAAIADRVRTMARTA